MKNGVVLFACLVVVFAGKTFYKVLNTSTVKKHHRINMARNGYTFFTVALVVNL